jgi:excisionase family DNA binding protein
MYRTPAGADVAPNRAERRHPATLPKDVEHLSWACERLEIGLSTGYRLAQSGRMPGAFQIGCQWRISVPAFEAAIHGPTAT